MVFCENGNSMCVLRKGHSLLTDIKKKKTIPSLATMSHNDFQPLPDTVISCSPNDKNPETSPAHVSAMSC